jgi:1-phosphatidylinositol-3-phosphate 5-kinase
LYTITSILSRVKNTFTNSTSTTAVPPTIRDPNVPTNPPGSDQRRPSYTTMPSQNSSTKSTVTEKPLSLTTAPAQVAPPLVSLTPAQSEIPTFSIEYDPSLPRRLYSPIYEAGEGASFGTSIPGFPIQDDARSIRTTTSLHRSGSVSKVMRRLRGEGTFFLISKSELFTVLQACRRITGWTTKTARNAMTVRACLLHGDASIIAGSVVRLRLVT